MPPPSARKNWFTVDPRGGPGDRGRRRDFAGDPFEQADPEQPARHLLRGADQRVAVPRRDQGLGLERAEGEPSLQGDGLLDRHVLGAHLEFARRGVGDRADARGRLGAVEELGEFFLQLAVGQGRRCPCSEQGAQQDGGEGRRQAANGAALGNAPPPHVSLLCLGRANDDGLLESRRTSSEPVPRVRPVSHRGQPFARPSRVRSNTTVPSCQPIGHKTGSATDCGCLGRGRLGISRRGPWLMPGRGLADAWAGGAGSRGRGRDEPEGPPAPTGPPASLRPRPLNGRSPACARLLALASCSWRGNRLALQRRRLTKVGGERKCFSRAAPCAGWRPARGTPAAGRGTQGGRSGNAGGRSGTPAPGREPQRPRPGGASGPPLGRDRY